jgi:hypothetical protein
MAQTRRSTPITGGSRSLDGSVQQVNNKKLLTDRADNVKGPAVEFDQRIYKVTKTYITSVVSHIDHDT